MEHDFDGSMNIVRNYRRIDPDICEDINILRPRQDGRYFSDDIFK